MSLPKELSLHIGGNDITVYRAKNDSDGNGRYVIDYLSLPFRERAESESFLSYQSAQISAAAAAIFGKRYRGKDYGGGIVFYSYDPAGDIAAAVARAEKLIGASE